ncbi:MAG: DNA gyrase inhibitor YacG [Candidatus Accumulibacter sp.]|nr:DNA gyrase inhibitor YacG [Accumulibacter sp.]
MSERPPQVRCPRCGAETPWSVQNPHRPFCSERCKLIDLGAWASEAYRVPVREEEPPEADLPR